MIRTWGSICVSFLFALGAGFLLRWFLSIADKNLDYVGLGLGWYEKTDAYIFRLFALFFVIVINKWILYILFSLRANLVFDVFIFACFLFLGTAILFFKIQSVT
jgi:hypothetical protein